MMNKRILLTFAISSFMWQGAAMAKSLPIDSVGVENRNGKTFVVHRVEPKETVFALSRRYRVAVDQIVKANANIQSGLSIGQIIYIPRAAAPGIEQPVSTPAAAGVPVAATAASKTFVVDAQGNKMHRVAPKQTLYAISRLYAVSPEDLKKWNKLTSNEISVGDELIVGVGSQPTATPQYVPEVDDDVASTSPAPVSVAKTMPPAEPISRPTATAAERNQPIATASASTAPVERTVSGSGAISKVTENGLAEIIENRTENNKYLALHKTAPIGTILQVKNVSNNQSVYVRVVGKMPETATNDKVIVKLSNRAYQKLAATNNQFRVEVSYMP
ncbi:MAG: peptidoglycan-binding protein [Cytophagales bacterium CG18_big_fil_WC_8_21_14_2_50_42_9]|nr:MAG: peptidoglycan-binding protein [Cytophagales bacterium CG18_big_fil_WC_8_21_14_2_50_42_9]